MGRDNRRLLGWIFVVLGIRHNAGSQSVQRHLGMAGRRVLNSASKLSSGDSMNSAADNAAGMAVKTNFRASLASRRQALRNTNEASNMLQTAETGIERLSELFTRARELSVHAANDSLGKRERIQLDVEFQDILDRVDTVFQSTEYNGRKLLDDGAGSYNPPPLTFQVGIGTSSGDKISLTMKFGLIKSRFDSGAAMGTLDLRRQTSAQLNIELFDRQMVELDRNRTRLGSTLNRLTASADQVSEAVSNESASLSLIADTDMGAVSSDLARQQVLQNAGVALLGQANSNPQAALRLLG